MKFTFLPKPKDEPIAALEAQAHQHVALEDNPDMVLFGGGPKDFPDKLPESVKVVQIQYAGVENLQDVLSLIHISEPTRPVCSSRMPSSA